MNNQNIEVTEGQRMKVILTISNETDLTNYDIEGYTKGFSRCNCSVEEFEVIEVKNNTVTLLTPSLKAGSHGYQLYITNINTNQQFKVAEGRIEVMPNYGHDSHLSEKYANIEATLHSDTIEMTMTINKGMQGDQGEKGDTGLTGEKGEKGDTGLSAYEIAKKHGYSGSEQSWVEEFQGAADAATEAKNAATEATKQKQISKNYSDASQRYSSEAENYKNYAENYFNSTIKQYEYAETAATAASQSELEARQLVTEANTLFTTATNTISNAAIKTANNTFSGTNTFNGTVAANSGITGLPSPSTETSAVNLETSRLMNFVNEVTIKEFGSKPVLKQGNGTMGESTTQTTLSCQKDNTINIITQGAFAQYTSSYISFNTLWIPFFCNMNHLKDVNNKFRIITQLATGFKGGSITSEETNSKFIYQWTDMSKPFTYFSNIEPKFQCGTLEIFCENKDGFFDITIFSPVYQNNQYSGVKMVKTKFSNGSWNYSGLNGILLVATANNKVKVFIRNFNNSQYQWIYAGEHYFIVSLYSGNNTTQQIWYAVQGTSKGVFTASFPHQLKMQTSKTSEYYPNCQTILKAVTTSYHTEQTLTLEEYEAMQQPETTV